MVLFFTGLSLLSVPLSLVALGAGFKGLKKSNDKKEKVFSWIGIVTGIGYILFTILGIVLYQIKFGF